MAPQEVRHVLECFEAITNKSCIEKQTILRTADASEDAALANIEETLV